MVENTPGSDDRDTICYKWAVGDPDSSDTCVGYFY
jgi:hypothetical protein